MKYINANFIMPGTESNARTHPEPVFDPVEILSQVPIVHFGYLPLRIRRVAALLAANVPDKQIAQILEQEGTSRNN